MIFMNLPKNANFAFEDVILMATYGNNVFGNINSKKFKTV